MDGIRSTSVLAVVPCHRSLRHTRVNSPPCWFRLLIQLGLTESSDVVLGQILNLHGEQDSKYNYSSVFLVLLLYSLSNVRHSNFFRQVDT